jgi:hypothetical protein
MCTGYREPPEQAELTQTPRYTPDNFSLIAAQKKSKGFVPGYFR